MADISDVENAFCALIETTIYPNGVANASVTGGCVKIYRGWPASRGLNADLGNNVQTVTVYAKENSTHNTTRYPSIWRTTSVQAPTLTVAVSGDTVVLGGAGGVGQAVGLAVDGVGYALAVGANDTPETIAQSMCREIGRGSVIGPALTVPGAALKANVVGSGVSSREIRRQAQGFIVALWCPNPASRDQLATVVDGALSTTDWLALADGTAAKLDYAGTAEIDTAENANLYRRNLEYVVEYPTIQSVTSSQMLFGIGTLGGSGATVGFGCLEPPDPLVIPPLGALRFDAWYDPANAVDAQCAAALSPAAFNFRLPGNAYAAAGGFTWPIATQATLDAEIAAALQAGLSFWAFDSYSPTDTLSLALQLYLSSSLRGRLRFCMLGQTSNWGAGGQDQPALLRDISMMTQPGYMTVLGGRPLYLVLDASAQQTAGLPQGGVPAAIALVRQRVQAAGGLDPYVVWLSGAALQDYSNVSAAMQAGADAAAAYATPRLNGSEQVYGALAAAASTDWADRAQAGFPMIPTAMTGWDQRPLIDTPQPFYPVGSSLTMSNYYDTATAAELGAHVVDMVQFVVANQRACPAQVGLIYAWNELAEGGWLMPTYTETGADSTRSATLGGSLAEAVTA